MRPATRRRSQPAALRARSRAPAVPDALSLVAVGLDYIEVAGSLTVRLAGLRVARERVERVAVIGDLELRAALRRPEERLVDAHAGDRLALRQQRRPRRRAPAGAIALV